MSQEEAQAALEAGLKHAMSGPCLFCYNTPTNAYVLPLENLENPGYARLSFYALCGECAEKPNHEERAKEIVLDMQPKSRFGPSLN